MQDPRIDELLGYIEDVNPDGSPTSMAVIARRVSSYLEVVAGLRSELAEHHKSVEALEVRAHNLTSRIDDRESLRADLIDDAQNAAMRAALSSSSGRGAQLRRESQEKHDELKQFEKDMDEDQERLTEAMKALHNRQTRLIETRDLIARRMNIVDALLQRAEIEWPSYFVEENERIRSQSEPGQRSVNAARRRRGRGRGRKTVFRRRKAG